MNCPVCKLAMIAVERDGVETDYCINCRGLWFDRGEVELLAEKHGLVLDAVALDKEAAATAAETKRHCPRCNQKMHKIQVGDAARVLIDCCPDGQGMWFDHRELGALIDHSAPRDPGSSQPLIRFLTETFGSKGG
ncbi:MAG TPA: zf-TFIIB domain-containing protein [Thermoanaerobaculia bacterium]